jgi:hypothetical protein
VRNRGPLCDGPIAIVAIVDPDVTAARFIGINVVPSYTQVEEPFDAVVVTHLTAARKVYDEAISNFGPERVLAPDLLGLRPRQQKQGAA